MVTHWLYLTFIEELSELFEGKICLDDGLVFRVYELSVAIPLPVAQPKQGMELVYRLEYSVDDLLYLLHLVRQETPKDNPPITFHDDDSSALYTRMVAARLALT